MNSRNRKLSRLFVALFLFFALAACTSSEPEAAEVAENDSAIAQVESANSNDATILTFAVDGWQRGLYENQVELFEEDNPDIKIEFITTDEIFGNQERDYEDPSGVLLQIAQQADVISTYFAPNGLDGLLLDLGPLMDQDESIDIDDFYSGALDLFSLDGSVYAIPTSMSFQLIFYDKDMFDAAGVEYPEIGWTWDEFLAKAQELTIKSGSETTQYGFAPIYGGMETLVSAKAGPMFNNSSVPPSLNFDDPEIIAGIEWYLSLYNDYGIIPNPKQPTSQEEYESGDFVDPYQLIEDDKVAMYLEQSDAFAWRSEQGKNIGVVPFPVSATNDNSTPLSGFAGAPLAISAGTAKTEAAWKWVSFVLNQGPSNNDGFSFGPPTGLPSRKSVAESSGVFDDMDPELAEALKYAAEHSFSVIYPQFGGEEYFQEMAKLTNEENPDVVQILAEAQKKYDEAVLEQVGADPTPIPDFAVAAPPSSQIDENDTVVSFVVAGGDPSAFRQLAKQYSEETPGVVIKIEEPNFYTDDFTLRSQVGDADCFQWWGPVTTPEDLQSVLSIQPFLDADSEISEDNFFPAGLDQFREEGQIMGLPSTVQIQLLSFNKMLFDEAGLDYPQAGWTLDDFLNAAVALTTDAPDDEKVYGFVPDLFETSNLFTFIDLQGSTMYNMSVDPPQANFNDPDFVSAVRWYTNLSTEYGVKARFEFDRNNFSQDQFQLRQDLIDGNRAGIWPYEDGSFQVITIDGEDQGPDRSNFGLVPYPQGANGSGGVNFSNGYYISADSTARQPCWEWIKYLTSQESISEYGAPARIDTAESAEFTARVGAENAKVLIDTLNSTKSGGQSQFALFSGWMGNAFQFLDVAFTEILSEESTVEEALQVAQDKADAYRQCIIENDLLESTDFEEFQECMKVADPDYDGF
ncbi:MAG: extracellular solute-binding protein [Anaerolineae bacterium]